MEDEYEDEEDRMSRLVDEARNVPVPCLMLVTDRHVAGGEDALVDKIGQAVEGGNVDVVQLREKDMTRPNLIALGGRLRDVTRGRCLLLVNTDYEVAREIEADGVHLPQGSDWPPSPWTYLWGMSAHDPESARTAAGMAARYIVLGPIFETSSHPGRPGTGLELIRDVSSWSGVPVVAIGGITRNRARDVIQAGAKGVAVVSAVLASETPREAAQALREAIDGAFPVRPLPRERR